MRRKEHMCGGGREKGVKKEEADKWGPLRVVGIEDDI